MSSIKVTKENFQREVVESNVPVLADFWAVWCGYCTKLAPTLDELSQELNGKIKLVKINVDEEPELTAKFGVEVFPTMLLFQNGAETDRAIGAVPKGQLADWLKHHGVA